MTLIRILAFLLTILVAGGIIALFRILQLPAQIRKAHEHLDNGDFQKAGEIARKVLKRKPNYVPARHIRSQIYMKTRQYFLAISEIMDILSTPDFRHHVNEADLHYSLAEMFNITQQYQKEIEEYRIILTFNPDDIKANHRIGHVHYRQKNFLECRDHLVKAYFQDQSLTDCLVPMGIASYYLSDYAAAETYLLKSLEHDQDNLEVRFHLGLIYRAKKDPDTAMKMFTLSKQERQYYVRSLHNMGEIYFENEMYDMAIGALEEGLGKVQDSGEESLAYRYLLAECYEAANKIKEAVYHWQKIQEQNPGYRSVRSKLNDYEGILESETKRLLFTASLEDLQPLISELISRLSYNIISRIPLSPHEYMYKAFNIKRMNEPPILINFNRSTREISESQIAEFHNRVVSEKSKTGIYITTSKFSAKAKNTAPSLSIELLDSDFLLKTIEKILSKRSKPGR